MKKVHLTHLQPRARRIWVTAHGKQYWFDITGIARYAIRTTPPDSAVSASERDIVNRISNRIAQVME